MKGNKKKENFGWKPKRKNNDEREESKERKGWEKTKKKEIDEMKQKEGNECLYFYIFISCAELRNKLLNFVVFLFESPKQKIEETV